MPPTPPADTQASPSFVPTSAPTEGASTDRHFVTALARGLQVLSCFRSSDKALGNQELAKRCGLPKSTISRLTHTLTQLGYLEHDPEAARYHLGTATLALGSTMLARVDIRQLARPLMQALADASQTMVSLGTRDRLSMIYVENCRSDAALTLSLDVGSRIPLATTAMGRAYLARCDKRERLEVMERVREFDEYAWAQVEHGMDKAMQEMQNLGVCTSFGDWQPDVNAIAIAFRTGDSQGKLMSLNCGGPATHVSREHLLEVVRPKLLQMVEKLGGH
jgi:DNA-binding IclR family transcriptional regulator